MKTELYQDLALQFFKEGHRHHNALFKGLKEEVKEVAKAKSKQERAEELGDVLWYVAVIAKQEGLNLDDIMHYNILKLEDRALNGKHKKVSN